jgi:hypothetical protein
MLRSVPFVVVTSLFVCNPAFADVGSDDAPDLFPQLAQWGITLLGLALAARLSWQAFGRAVPVADAPVFPRYMTSRQQYLLGSWAFVLVACGIFLLLIQENRQVILLAPLFPVIPEIILQAVKAQSAPYLLVVSAMGAVFLFLLTKETQWNALLMMRDLIHTWISVPQLAKQIIAEIRYSLRVPTNSIPVVIANAPAVTAADFQKGLNTPDRMWAEICYMKWWLFQLREAGKDATFFTEDSFGFDQLTKDSQQASYTMARWKAGTAPELDAAAFTKTLKDLHNKFRAACGLLSNLSQWSRKKSLLRSQAVRNRS